MKNINVSDETVRQVYNSIHKYNNALKNYGLRYADQIFRNISSYHTPYSNYRMELDFTKASMFLYPTEKSKEPTLYNVGFSAEHNSKAAMASTSCINPSSASVVRLLKRAVLPSPLFASDYQNPDSIEKLRNFMPFGVCDIYAMDNGSEFISKTNISMYLELGGIPLLLPPRRGDLKGSVERMISTLENSWLSKLPGFFQNIAVTDDRYKSEKQKAMDRAVYTVSEFNGILLNELIQYNNDIHPTIKSKSRNEVWIDNLELNPICYPSPQLNIDLIFSLRFDSSISNRGVFGGNDRRYNSLELTEYWNTKSSSKKVKVHVNPDDVRQAYVVVPEQDAPILAHLQNQDLPYPMTVELYKVIFGVKPHDSSNPGETKPISNDVLKFSLDEIIDSSTSSTGTTSSKNEQKKGSVLAVLPEAITLVDALSSSPSNLDEVPPAQDSTSTSNTSLATRTYLDELYGPD